MAGFGIKKLQITLVVEDDKVSLEELQEKIEEFDEYVQSTDIVRNQIWLDLIFRLRCPNCRLLLAIDRFRHVISHGYMNGIFL